MLKNKNKSVTTKDSEVIKGHIAHYIDYKSKKYHFITFGATLCCFAVIGSFLVFGSFAAVRLFVSSEPESSTKVGNVSNVTDSTASNSSALRFDAPPAATCPAGQTGTPPNCVTPPPTPPPTGTRVCPAYPAFPDASCTGVPTSTTMTTVNGNLNTSSVGQVIDGKIITGDLIVNHANVTVKNSRIKGRVANSASNNLVIIDSDIGPDNCPASKSDYNGIDGSNYTLTRTIVHNNAADLVRIGGSGTILIQDSIINRACYYDGDHLDAIQLYSPGNVPIVTIKHTKIDVRPENISNSYGNAAVFWADFPGSGARLTVTQSSLAGGGYTTALYDATATSGVIIDVNNSTYVRNSYQYGPCSSSNSVPFNGTSGVKFTNNIYDNGTAISGC